MTTYTLKVDPVVLGVGLGLGAAAAAALIVYAVREKDKPRVHTIPVEVYEPAALPPIAPRYDGLVDATGKAPTFRVVLTGGPCGGKTSALRVLSDKFKAEGWRVYAVPEVATLLWSGGISTMDLQTKDAVYHFQTNMIKVMTALEDAYMAMARLSGQKSIVFCDRGIMDCSAYMEGPLWQAMLDENHWTAVGLRDGRYDCVVHLVTAAIGAEQHYNTETNRTRTETIPQAAAVDRRLQKAWLGHPYLVILDNSTDFPSKLDRAVGVVYNRADGRVEPGYSKRKFLVGHVPPDDEWPVAFQDFSVEYHYLIDENGLRSRIRKRGQYGTYTYTRMDFGQNSTSRSLTGREYLTLLELRDVTRLPVRQRQRYFIHNGHCFHLNFYISPHKGVIILQVYMKTSVTNDLPADLFPPWIDVRKEVTNDPDFNMYRMSSEFIP